MPDLATPDLAAPPDAALVDAALPPDTAAPIDASAPPDLTIGGARVRILAGNITSGGKQAYEAPGIRILQGLHPDIALLQELNHGSSTEQEIRSFVDEAFGPGFEYYREPGNLQIPNGVVSRFPILESGSWDDPTISNRDFAWARIDVPGPRDLWAVSVHLSTTNPDRPTGAMALVNAINGKVPPGDLLVVGGDFNTDSRDEVAVKTLGTVAVVGAPWPADQNNNGFTSAPRTRPYDWLIFDGDLTARAIPLEIGVSWYASGLVFDSRIYTPLAEVQPVLQGDSGAVGMQHMAVVRDVALE